MRRREFITALGGAVAWPVVARGQQPERKRRIGALAPGASDAPLQRVRIEAFLQALQPLGWSVGRNLQLDARWATNDADLRKQAAELVAAAPDVILASTNQALASLRQATHTVPIVFVIAIDLSAMATSQTSRALAAMRRAFCCMNTALAENGWNCSNRSRQA